MSKCIRLPLNPKAEKALVAVLAYVFLCREIVGLEASAIPDQAFSRNVSWHTRASIK